MDFPVDFTEKIKLPAQGGGTGYPYRISANDLMQNFHFAALDAEKGWIGSSDDSLYQTRKLKLPKIPEGEGLFVLGVSAGEFQWVETLQC